MNHNTQDVFSKWWQPGQWLQIVWSVWIDQKWYWQNVYPRLNNRKTRWGILLQALLGTAFIALTFSVILGSILVATRVLVDLEWLIRYVVMILGTVCVAAVIVNWYSASATASIGLVAGVVFGIAGSLIPPVTLLIHRCIPIGDYANVVKGLVIGLVIGIGMGMGLNLSIIGEGRAKVGRGRVGIASCVVAAIGLAVMFAVWG